MRVGYIVAKATYHKQIRKQGVSQAGFAWLGHVLCSAYVMND
jgi:hypothetical protein